MFSFPKARPRSESNLLDEETAQQLQTLSGHLPFLSFPGEIRNKIYKYVLDAASVETKGKSLHASAGELNPSPQRVWKNNGPYYWKTHPFPLCFTLFRINKRIYEEASAIFYATNKFVLVKFGSAFYCRRNKILDTDDIPFFVAPETIANQCKRHVMEVELKLVVDEVLTSAFFPLYCVPRLLSGIRDAIDHRTWLGPSYSICMKLYPHTPYEPTYLQIQEILEPWRELHSLRHAVIKFGQAAADCSPDTVHDYFSALENELTRDRFDARKWLADVQSQTNTAYALFSRGLKEDAYYNASRAINILSSYYTPFYSDRAPQLNAFGSDFAKAVNKIRFNLELLVADFYYQCKRNDSIWIRDAISAADNAVNLCTNTMIDSSPWMGPDKPPNNSSWYSVEERVRALVRRATTNAVLARMRMEFIYEEHIEQAYEDFNEAMRLRPGDASILEGAKEVKWAFAYEVEGDWSAGWDLAVRDDVPSDAED